MRESHGIVRHCISGLSGIYIYISIYIFSLIVTAVWAVARPGLTPGRGLDLCHHRPGQVTSRRPTQRPGGQVRNGESLTSRSHEKVLYGVVPPKEKCSAWTGYILLFAAKNMRFLHTVTSWIDKSMMFMYFSLFIHVAHVTWHHLPVLFPFGFRTVCVDVERLPDRLSSPSLTRSLMSMGLTTQCNRSGYIGHPLCDPIIPSNSSGEEEKYICFAGRPEWMLYKYQHLRRGHLAGSPSPLLSGTSSQDTP